MPNKQSHFEGQVSDPNRKRHQVREQRHAGVRLKEFLADREQRMVQKVFDSWKVNLSVFSVGVVTMYEQGGDA